MFINRSILVLALVAIGIAEAHAGYVYRAYAQGMVKAQEPAAAAADCALPWGSSLTSGSGVTAYQASSVAYGVACASETRTCANGSLSGSFVFASCAIQEPATCTTPWGTTVSHGAAVLAFQEQSVPGGAACVSESRTCDNGTLSGAYRYSGCEVQKSYAKWSENVTAGTSSTMIHSDDGLTLNAPSLSPNVGARANVGVSSGKWYWEVSTNGSALVEVGVSNKSASLTGNWPLESGGNSGIGAYLHSSGSNVCTWTGCGLGGTWTPGAQAVGTVLGIAFDADNNTVSWFINGKLFGTTTTANSTRFAALMATKATQPVYPTINAVSGVLQVKTNFGQSPFVYSPPVGFSSGLYPQ